MRRRVRRLPDAKPDERDLLREALLRLPQGGDAEMALRYLCTELERLRLEANSTFVSMDGCRRPESRMVALIAGTAYMTATGKPVTRISKRVAGKNGKQEAGPFADFLAEIFKIVGIKASAAGQVRTLIERHAR
jgi:hypothetical protein